MLKSLSHLLTLYSDGTKGTIIFVSMRLAEQFLYLVLIMLILWSQVSNIFILNHIQTTTKHLSIFTSFFVPRKLWKLTYKSARNISKGKYSGNNFYPHFYSFAICRAGNHASSSNRNGTNDL